jgi:flagellar biosynthetic protein FliR
MRKEQLCMPSVSSNALQAPLLLVFLLVFARVSGTILAAPIFSERGIPMPVKIGFSALLAFILTPQQAQKSGAIATDPASFVLLLGEQVLLGLAFALVFIVVYRSAEAAGGLIGQQMGVTLGGGMNETGDGQNQAIGQLYTIIAGLIFLGLDGLHWVLLGLGDSLDTMPVTKVTLSNNLVQTLMPLGGAAIEFAVGLALPVLATLLLADFITGLLGRAMPALNLFVLGLPLKIALGVLAIMVALPFTIALLSNDFQNLTYLKLWH